MANCLKLSSNTTAVTTITTIPEGMTANFSENISEILSCMDDNVPSVVRLSKGHISHILGTVSCVKLKLIKTILAS